MKKIYTLLLLAPLLFSTITVAEDYTSELQTAYSYAYSIGITTQGSIDSANMYGSLIRAHMAKMMVNYAKQVLGIQPDLSLSCTFTDVASESTELKGYIKEACQMGLMGQGITAFSPDTTVTRAQFGTVLSRALYGDMFNGGDPYYANHLQALKDAKIMNSIATPSASEIRGYVMLMMMRAGETPENSAPSACESLENQLACMVGSSTCPIECQTTDDSNTGTVKVSSATISVGSIASDVKYVGSFKLTATDQDVVLKSLSLQKVGSFTQGRIEENGINIANIHIGETDSAIMSSFSPGIMIKQGTSKIFSVFIDGNNGQSQGVALANSQGIQSTASIVDGSFPYRLVK